MVTILLLVLAQDTAALIRDLDHDDIEIRDRAQQRLERMASSSGQVDQAIAAHPSREAEPRLRRIADALRLRKRIEEFGGGEPVSGFSARVEADGTDFKIGDVIRLTITFMNLDDVERKVPRFLDVMDVVTPSQAECRLSAVSALRVTKVGAKHPIETAIDDRKPTAVVEEWKCRPNDQVARAVALFAVDDPDTISVPALPPGEYDIVFTYYAKTKDLLPDAASDLVSRPLRIRIER